MPVRTRFRLLISAALTLFLLGANTLVTLAGDGGPPLPK
jgi:hypothetical protein